MKMIFQKMNKSPNINNYGTDANGNLIFGIRNSLKQNNKSNPSIKIKDKQKINRYRHSKKDYWKFCIYPYFLIKKNKQLNGIKDEICSILSVENILEIIKSLELLYSLKSEFNDQVIESKMILNNCSRIRGLNCESKSKIEIAKLSELVDDK